MVGIVAIYGIAVTHNTFALDRARLALAAELRTDGVPDTSVDNGWEYNLGVELQHSDFINNPDIVVPAHAYIPIPPLPAGTCPMWLITTTHPTSSLNTASRSIPMHAADPHPSLR